MHGSTSRANFNLFQGKKGFYFITSLKMKNTDYLPATSKVGWRIHYSGAECLSPFWPCVSFQGNSGFHSSEQRGTASQNQDVVLRSWAVKRYKIAMFLSMLASQILVKIFSLISDKWTYLESYTKNFSSFFNPSLARYLIYNSSLKRI